MFASLTELLLLSFALALDAAAVSAGLGTSGAQRSLLLRAALLFGVAQGGMAGLGALGGAWLATWTATWDHWVAFALLALVGGRMIAGGGDDEPDVDGIGARQLLVLAIATSIDSLASGVGLPLLAVPVLVSVCTIGVVTTALSLVSGRFAKVLAGPLGHRAEQLAGGILIAIGARIVITHEGWLPALFG